MGVYVDQAGYEARYGRDELIRLTDGDTDVDTAVLDAAIADAEAEVNSYLAQRYALPLPEVSAAVQRATYDVLRYRLHNDGADEGVRNRYTDAIKWLRDVVAGKAGIGVTTDEPDETAAGTVSVVSRSPRFGSDYQERRNGLLPN